MELVPADAIQTPSVATAQSKRVLFQPGKMLNEVESPRIGTAGSRAAGEKEGERTSPSGNPPGLPTQQPNCHKLEGPLV